LYFIPLVFIGAFFLLNLTLAVINSEFTKATKEQKAKDEEEKHTKNAADDSDDEMDRALTDKDKWSIM
jgi:preprotein translocase subunit SecG